jgi:ribosomal protein S18 acetylase RimI-like enzyme
VSDFPTGFSNSTKPLEADKLDEKGRGAARRLAAQGYEVHLGLTPDFAGAIAAMALEPAIREYCPKDATERFTDQAATEHWLSKRRAVFLLLKRDDKDVLHLVGYGWAGPGTSVQVPEGQTTFALRVGEAGQGQGLAEPFSWLIVAATAILYGARNFWLETWASNGAAVHVYHKLDFETVSEVPSERPTANGQKVADTRVYMDLSDQLLPSLMS